MPEVRRQITYLVMMDQFKISSLGIFGSNFECTHMGLSKRTPF